VKAVDSEFNQSYIMLVVTCTDQSTESMYIPMLHELAMAGVDPNVTNYRGQSPLGKLL